MPATRTRRRRIRGEKGYVLILTAMLIIPLTIFTAFGVDLGAWYGQAAKQQRAVDAASLAGVVQLPTTANAINAALASLKANGFPCGASNTSYATSGTPSSTTPCVFTFPSGTSQEMQVQLYQPAQQYFSGMVIRGEHLTRSATAVYNLHIPLGTPTNTFGNDPTRTGSCNNGVGTGCSPNLWAAINGPYSNHADGDPYATKCAGNNGGSATSCSSTDSYGNTVNPISNQQYNADGYIWAIDVPAADAGTTVRVELFDPAFGPNSALSEGYSGNNTGFSTSYQLFNSNGSYATDPDNYKNQGLGMNSVANGPSGGTQGLNKCTNGTPGYKVFGAAGSTSTMPTSWYVLCTFAVPNNFQGGIYPLQVKTSNIPGVTDSGTGYNAYSVKAESTGTTQPNVYGLQDLSIWTPTTGASKFYLANVGPQYAGHTLQIDLYDPGDGNSGDYYMQFLAPPAGSPAYVPTGGTPVACYYSDPAQTIGGKDPTNYSSNCNIQTRNSGTSPANIYNERWLRVRITIPTATSLPAAAAHCQTGDTTDCWWSIKYTFGGTPTDRTVWVVNVLGDPVHLIN